MSAIERAIASTDEAMEKIKKIMDTFDGKLRNIPPELEALPFAVVIDHLLGRIADLEESVALLRDWREDTLGKGMH